VGINEIRKSSRIKRVKNAADVESAEDADIIFSSCFFFLFSSPNLSGRRLDVHHTSTHGVILVQI